jgi:tripartite-type tricarboxylate transporter receptor subunit TctC
MRLTRRRFLHFAASAVVLPAASRIARAQAYPSRPVRILVGFPAGSSGDIVARLIGQWLQERLGQPFVIENRPGGATNIATQVVVNAAPDGYTLLLATTAGAINATLYDKLNFNFVRDIAPVATIYRATYVMEINPSVPAKTAPEFIAYARLNPGKLNVALAGVGGASHLSAELFKMMTGVNMVDVPYSGSPAALTDLIAGRVQLLFDPLSTSIEYIKAGKLRALGVTTASRWAALPDVPTVAETVPGYEASGWLGVGAPKDTAPEIVAKLNKEINTALADTKIKTRFADLGGTPLVLSPADFARLIAAETEKWAKVIRAANINPV